MKESTKENLNKEELNILSNITPIEGENIIDYTNRVIQIKNNLINNIPIELDNMDNLNKANLNNTLPTGNNDDGNISPQKENKTFISEIDNTPTPEQKIIGKNLKIYFELLKKENITSSTYSDMQYVTGLSDSQIKRVLPYFRGIFRRFNITVPNSIIN